MTTERIIELATNCQAYTVAEEGNRKAGVFIEYMTPKDFSEIFQLAQKQLLQDAQEDLISPTPPEPPSRFKI